MGNLSLSRSRGGDAIFMRECNGHINLRQQRLKRGRDRRRNRGSEGVTREEDRKALMIPPTSVSLSFFLKNDRGIRK